MAKKKLKLVRRPLPANATADAPADAVGEAAGEVAAATVEQASSQPAPAPDSLATATATATAMPAVDAADGASGTGDIELGHVAARGEATDAAANLSSAVRGNRPRGLSLDIEHPNNEAPESADQSADPHLASGRVSPGAGPSAGAIMLPTPTHKSTPTPKHGKGVVHVGGGEGSPRKKTPPTDTEDGMASSDEEGGGTNGGGGGEGEGAGVGGTDYMVVHADQTNTMAGVDPNSREGTAPLSPTRRGGDVTDPDTQTDMKHALEREKDKMIQRKKDFANTQMVKVSDHPKYKEYIKFDKLGVTGRLLEKMMKEDGLFYGQCSGVRVFGCSAVV